MDTATTDKATLRILADLPGPNGLPLLGNARQIDPVHFHQTMENWSREHGPVYRFSIMGKQFVAISRHEDIAQVLRDRPETFSRSVRIREILEEAGMYGVFSAEGEDWKRQRKLVMRGLTPEVIHHFYPTLAAMTERLRARWAAQLAQGKEVDLLRDLKAWTLDVTIALSMGQDINTLERETDPLQRDIEYVFASVGRRLTTPIAYWRYFKLPQDHALDAAFRRIHDATAGFVTQARIRLLADPGLRQRPSNLLEAFVAARDEPESGLDDAHVIGNAMTMVFAGEDTTSNSAAWLLDYVARDARVAAAMADEADAILHNAPVLKDFHMLEKLSYMELATREAMRLKPVAPYLAMETRHSLALAGVHIPEGTLIACLVRRAAELAAPWPDAQAFRPERWMEQAGSINDPNRTMFPFGGGPRFCPGRYLALAEIKMVLSMLFKNFRLELEEGAPPPAERFTFTVTPGTLPVRLRPR